MDISQAKALTTPRKRHKRIGRGPGSGHGRTSGRGRDGAASRSGFSHRGLSGGNIALWRRLPKVGFSNAPFKRFYCAVNVGQLTVFPADTHVTPELLKERGLAKRVGRSGVKILGGGELGRPLTVRAHAFSQCARLKIEAAGGRVELIPGPRKPVRHKMRPRPARSEESR